MPSIHILQPHVANQIAAGEVVERPASVVKELVENALDAGATTITVRIENGGMRSITVSDNGSGIARVDCRNAFLRHATSKITSAEDLTHIMTLGFRGEALASIASVARVNMTTRVKDSDCGTHLILENGNVVKEEEASSVFGTTFVVEELFANMPARLKFLKSSRTEAGYIGDYVGKMILAKPDVSFRYESDGKTVYESYGDGNLFNALFCVYGKNIADKLVPVEYDNGYMRVSGFLGFPEIARSNRSFQTLFVNGRSIRSLSVSAAVAQAYDTRLMIGRFPFYVLNLYLAPQEVDVNVHPTKSEVRFADENRVFSNVAAAVRLSLASTQQHIESALDHVVPKQPDISINPAEKPQTDPLRIDFRALAASGKTEYTYRESNYSGFRNMGTVGSVKQYRIEPDDRPKVKTESLPLFTDTPIRVIGCAFLTYWIVERGEQLFLIDQHAAHERKLYDALSSREAQMNSQQLLMPREVVLTPSEMECWQAHQDVLISLGYGLIKVGALSLSISSVPILNGQTLQEDYLHEVLSIIESQGKDPKEELLRERMMQSACKHAIKGGEPIPEEEIRTLLEQFLNGEVPLTCPHGRPVVVRMTKTELEKMFRRIV